MVVAGERRRSTVRSTQHAQGKLGTKGPTSTGRRAPGTSSRTSPSSGGRPSPFRHIARANGDP